MMERLTKSMRLTTAEVVTGSLTFIFLTIIQLFRLATITENRTTSIEEATLRTAQHSWSALWQHPLYAPYLLLIHVINYFSQALLYQRMVGALLGLLICGMFYYVIYNWLGYKLAVLGTLMFGCSNFLLHTDRIINPAPMQILVSLGLIVLYCLTSKNPRGIILWYWAIIIPVMLYIPGSIWLIIVAFILNFLNLKMSWHKQTKIQKIGIATVALVILIPLLHYLSSAFLNHMQLISLDKWIGLNLPNGREAIVKVIKSFVLIPVKLFWHGNNTDSPALSLGKMAVLDISASALTLLGLYVSFLHRRIKRWRINIIFFIIGALTISLGQESLAFIMPSIYILVTIGMAYMLSEWYHVFPRNPLARGFGLALITTVVSLSCLYNLRSYFIAWPNNQATHNSFSCLPQNKSAASCPQNRLYI